jgi:hypothetical protein
MTGVVTTLRRVANDLDRLGCRWALVGGFAVSARAEPRFTRDVDVALAVPDDATAEGVVRFFLSEGYGLLASVEQDATGRLATIRLASSPRMPDQNVVVDLLFASSGVEPEIVGAAERLEILPGLFVPVALTGHLIAVKVLARDDQHRPQDLADLRALLAVAAPSDIELTRTTLELITQRGFHRDRDLRSSLDDLMANKPS